jgi:hypothetical protein
MDEHLRDNVARLLKGSPAEPSPELSARVDSKLRAAAPPERSKAWVPLAMIAAAVAAALLVWVFRQDQGTSAAPQEDGVVTGMILLDGAAPPARKFWTQRMGGLAKELYPDGLVIEPVEVDGSDRVKGCLVYVKKGLEGKTFPVPQESKRMVFDRMRVEPRHLGIMVGQNLILENRDKELHNAHVMPLENKESNQGKPSPGVMGERSFTKPEVGIVFKCDCHHDWERARITVLSHPFYATTDEKGRFEIKGLPPGNYVLEAWYENCVPLAREIVVPAKGGVTANLALRPKTPRIDVGDLKNGCYDVKGLEGRVLDMKGTMEPAPAQDGRFTVKLQAGDWGGFCTAARGSEEKLKAYAPKSLITLRGLFKGTLTRDDARFLMEDCVPVEEDR